MKQIIKVPVLLTFIASLFTPQLKAQPKITVDIIITGTTIYSVDSGFRKYESMAINEGKVLDIGTSKEIEKKYHGRQQINGKGKAVYPGFIDAHCHFSEYALERYECKLSGTTSYNDVIKRLIAYNEKNKLPWIFARGWDQNDWKEKSFPNKDTLDKLFPDKQVILERIDGHAVLANQKALDIARISEASKIDGGVIEKKNGKLTGILLDNAMDVAEKALPHVPRNMAVSYMKELESDCYADGLTGVVDCGVTKPVIRLLRDLYDSNMLNIGYTVMLANDTETFNTYLRNGPEKYGQLQIAGIKIYADGALGSRGACLLKPYSDDPNNSGFLVNTVADMTEVARLAIKYNWQLCTHAIGDSANRIILKIYAKALKDTNDRRWRVEHAQIIAPEDLHYFKDYNIIPSVQPTHAIADMAWAGSRLGKDRLPEGYAYKSLLQQNNWIALGTDFPVEDINPINTFYTAVWRKNKDGLPKSGFLNENALTREEALKGMTIWCAKSVFMDGEKGSLEKGKDADIIILNTDIMKAQREKILKTKVLYTIVKGKIQYINKKYN